MSKLPFIVTMALLVAGCMSPEEHAARIENGTDGFSGLMRGALLAGASRPTPAYTGPRLVHCQSLGGYIYCQRY